jgi:acetyltransferase-like isoleucine patch superfamily enzyme
MAAYSYLVGGGHDITQTDIAIVDQKRPSRGIMVGPNGWIGAGVTVLDGVTIGHDVVVGANSVVTKDLEDFAVVAGSPAGIIRVRQARPAVG